MDGSNLAILLDQVQDGSDLAARLDAVFQELKACAEKEDAESRNDRREPVSGEKPQHSDQNYGG